MPLPDAHQHITVALFIVLDALFRNGLGRSCKRWRAGDEVMFDAMTMAAATELFTHHHHDLSESDEASQVMFARGSQSINLRQHNCYSAMMQWITDPFWFDNPEFKLNLHVSHLTFLHIV
jgi:hypothetical protein